ncbi:nodulation protein [Aliikangiella marina]|uniref:Nodulation protein n=1 Tax=Aliikangiella marina TaxID=1712262 RepID=A0A545TJH2_9GAMM|nr:carbamoyltransferase C-terminal domain-containing protein [Aliikangiella marina]TQV77375.1 nodulation protein [Aliikangiella marina]
MYILGLQTGAGIETRFNRDGFSNHDSAAVLLKDGEIIAAIEEERLSRVKHCNFFPRRAIEFCLQQANICLSDVDYIALNYSEYDAHSMASLGVLEDAKTKVASAHEFAASEFMQFFAQDVKDKIVFCSHHLAHVWSATPLSGFDESLVVVLDGNGPSGDGKMLSGLVGVHKNSEFNTLAEIPAKKSLGHFYIRSIRLVGYNRFDEYKVMGLAPYGDPNRFAKEFQQLYRLKDQGDYDVHHNPGVAMWQQLYSLPEFSSPRRKGEEFTQAHKDFAASLQATLEKLILHIVENYQQSSGMKYLCLAGGVAHNCTANGKIVSSKMFDEIFVQPAAHDAGGALGAALYAHNLKSKQFQTKRLEHLFYGTEIPSNEVIEDKLKDWSSLISYKKVSPVTEHAAQLIADGSIIAWVQGRSEFGPRALGSRSILADPRPASNRDKINKMVKKREGYRPFAPSVLEEYSQEYFEIEQFSNSLQFMNLIVSVKEEYKEKLGAITHVDGTARIQTVNKNSNSRYWELISKFNELSGVPILLNTSFNNNVEPIVDSVEDAIASYLTTDLDILIVGDYVIERKPELTNNIANFQIRLRESYKLSKGFKQTNQGFETFKSIEFASSGFFAKQTHTISNELFEILAADNRYSIAHLADQLRIELTSELLLEILNLWELRVIQIMPK